MKKIFSLFAAVLFAGSMMADVVTLTMSDYAAAEFSAKGISVTTAKNNGSTAPTYNATGKDLRIYAKGSITFSAAVNIKAISFEISTAGKKRLAPLTPSVGSASVAGDPDFTATWEGEAKEITLTVGDQAEYGTDGASKAGQLDFTAITVTLEGEGGDPDPVVANFCQTEVGHFMEENANQDSYVLLSIGSKNGKTIVRIDQDEAKNTAMFDYLQVTGITQTGEDVAEGGAKAMAVEFDTPTPVNDSLTLEILWSTVNWGGRWMVQNIRVAIAECQYAVLVPAPVVKKTCAELYSMAKNDEAALNDVVVTYVDGKKVYARDETAAIMLFLSANSPWKVGDVLSGVAGKIDIYNGIYELVLDGAQAAAVVATAGEAPAPEKLTAVDKDQDMSKLILLEGVTAEGEFVEGSASNITITAGENTYTLRSQYKNAFTFVAGKKYDVTALVTLYQSNIQLYFISAQESVGTSIENAAVAAKAQKVIRDGQLYIIRNGVMFNANGAAVK